MWICFVAAGQGAQGAQGFEIKKRCFFGIQLSMSSGGASRMAVMDGGG